MVSLGRANLVVEVKVDWDAAWEPHVGYRLANEGEVVRVRVSKMVKPMKAMRTEDVEAAWKVRKKVRMRSDERDMNASMEEKWVALGRFGGEAKEEGQKLREWSFMLGKQSEYAEGKGHGAEGSDKGDMQKYLQVEIVGPVGEAVCKTRRAEGDDGEQRLGGCAAQEPFSRDLR